MPDGAAATDPVPAAQPRCALGARACDIDPIGTAGAYDGYLLVEWPLPWPRDASEVPALDPVVRRLERLADQGRPHRLQLVARDGGPPDGRHSVVLYRAHGPAFAGFGRRELSVPRRDVVDGCHELLDATAHDDVPPSGPHVVDVLVCTHGARDVCCGTQGTLLHKEVAGTLPDGTALWRTSHTGGHRFAPTAITFPDGQCWAYLDPGLLGGLVRRSADPSSLRRHYRGSAGMRSREAQAVEREAFVAEGWGWLGAERHATTVERQPGVPDAGTDVVLRFSRADGSVGAYEATVGLGPPVALPPCRSAGGKGTVDRAPVVHRFERPVVGGAGVTAR